MNTTDIIRGITNLPYPKQVVDIKTVTEEGRDHVFFSWRKRDFVVLPYKDGKKTKILVHEVMEGNFWQGNDISILMEALIERNPPPKG